MGFLALLLAIILLFLLAERIKHESKIKNKKRFNLSFLVIFILFIVSLIGYGITHSRDVKQQKMEAAASQKAAIASSKAAAVSSQKAAASSSSYKKFINSKKAFVKYSDDDDGYGLTANKKNIINTKLTLNHPAKVSYKIDDPSEAKVINFTKTSATTYSLSIKMLNSSKDDYGTYIYIHTNRDGYKATKKISIDNYASKHDDSDDKSASSATFKSKKTTKSQKSSDRKSKAKIAKFNASIHNLPKSTNGVISKVKYKINLVNDVSIDLTISDATLDNISNKELKRLCFNMYRKVKSEAQKAGLSLSYLAIDDEQNDLLASYQRFGFLTYYGMGADVNA